MRAGLLRNRITVQEPAETVDDYGDPLQVWDTKFQLWAQVMGGTGSEPRMDGAPENVLRRQFVVRYRTDVNNTHRILWPTTSDIWDIEDASDIEGRQRLTTITAVKHG